MKRYRNGAEANTKVPKSSTFRLPTTSDREAAGKLTSIPGIVEAAAMKPNRSVGVPRLVAKGFRTGFLDIVELRIAKAPITHSSQKNFSLESLIGDRIHRPA